MKLPGLWLPIALAAMATLGPAPAKAADSADGTTFRRSFGLELDAWPSGFGAYAGLWVVRGRFVGGIHLRGQALSKMWDHDEAHSIGALAGAYGVQVGMLLGRALHAPYFLAGYDRVGSVSTDEEGTTGGGRTQQEINLEAGLRVWQNSQSDSFVGVRCSIPFDRGTHAPPGPPLPRAALVAAAMF